MSSGSESNRCLCSRRIRGQGDFEKSPPISAICSMYEPRPLEKGSWSSWGMRPYFAVSWAVLVPSRVPSLLLGGSGEAGDLVVEWGSLRLDGVGVADGEGQEDGLVDESPDAVRKSPVDDAALV